MYIYKKKNKNCRYCKREMSTINNTTLTHCDIRTYCMILYFIIQGQVLESKQNRNWNIKITEILVTQHLCCEYFVNRLAFFIVSNLYL